MTSVHLSLLPASALNRYDVHLHGTSRLQQDHTVALKQLREPFFTIVLVALQLQWVHSITRLMVARMTVLTGESVHSCFKHEVWSIAAYICYVSECTPHVAPVKLHCVVQL